tara:strand:+ start:97 stop:294 length:198 start_codon:yes stop_codon:yes gene_type:complete
MALDNFYTINEIAEKLKITPSTVFAKMRMGKIEFIKCDGRTLFSEKAIEDYLSKHTHKVVVSQDE